MSSNRSSKANSPLKRRTFSKELPIDSHVEYETELNRNLDKFWKDKAEKELGENEDAKEKILQLRHLLTCNGRRDDAFLLRFLRAKKFDVDKALKMVNIDFMNLFCDFQFQYKFFLDPKILFDETNESRTISCFSAI